MGQVRRVLILLVRRHGKDLGSDPRRLRNLLADYCPANKREVFAVSIAAEHGIPREIAQASQSLLWESISGRLVRKLLDETAIAPEDARQAVETWAMVLGRIPAPSSPPIEAEEGSYFDLPMDEEILEIVPVVRTGIPLQETPNASRSIPSGPAPAHKASKPNGPSVSKSSLPTKKAPSAATATKGNTSKRPNRPIGNSEAVPENTKTASAWMPTQPVMPKTPATAPRRNRQFGKSMWIVLGTLMALLMVTLAVVWWTRPSHSAEMRAAFGLGNPRVVLVGVDETADKAIRPRKLAEDDARALYDLFTNPDHLGLPSSSIRLLLGGVDKPRKAQKATREAIIKALRWAASAQPGDLVIVAFFTPGVQQDGKAAFFTSESIWNNGPADAVSDADISEAFAPLTDRHRLAVFLDVDFRSVEDPTIEIPIARIESPAYRAFLGDDGTADHQAAQGRQVFVSSNDGRPSPEAGSNSLFVTALLSGMRGDAAGNDENEKNKVADGVINTYELILYIKRQIRPLALRLGVDPERLNQNPFWLGSTGCRYPLTFNPKLSAEAFSQLTRFEDRASELHLAEDLLRQGRTFLRQRPLLKRELDLREEFIRFADARLTDTELDAVKKRWLTESRLDAKVSEEFADKVLSATRLIDQHIFDRISQGEMVEAASRGLYRYLDEPLPDNLKVKLAQAGKLPQVELKRILVEVRGHLGVCPDLDGRKALDVTLRAMTKRLDPQSSYLNPTEKAAHTANLSGFVGIGIVVRQDPKIDRIRVLTPLKDSPAHRAGIQAGDVIEAIICEGNEVNAFEVTQTQGLSLQEAVQKICGKEGTEVKLKIMRTGWDHPREFALTRDKVNSETVLGYHRNPDSSWNFFQNGQDQGIAYLRITEFTNTTESELAHALADIRKSNPQGLILDLRNNPGGPVLSAVAVAGQFVSEKLITIVEKRDGTLEPYLSHSKGQFLDLPLICLVNRKTASASETVIACLQDHRRAVVMGERTFGCASVQTNKDFEEGKFILTSGIYKRPSGKRIDRKPGARQNEDWGVLPDLQIPITLQEAEALIEYQKQQLIIGSNPPPLKDRVLDAAIEAMKVSIKKDKLLREQLDGGQQNNGREPELNIEGIQKENLLDINDKRNERERELLHPAIRMAKLNNFMFAPPLSKIWTQTMIGSWKPNSLRTQWNEIGVGSLT